MLEQRPVTYLSASVHSQHVVSLCPDVLIIESSQWLLLLHLLLRLATLRCLLALLVRARGGPILIEAFECRYLCFLAGGTLRFRRLGTSTTWTNERKQSSVVDSVYAT